MRQPEQKFVVEVTSADGVVCRASKEPEQRIRLADLGAVYVETNNSCP